MRVLFVTNMYPVNTYKYYGIHVKEQIDYLSDNFQLNSFVYFINAHEKGKFEYIKSIFKLPSLIKRESIDVVHIHYGLAGMFLLFFKPIHVKIFMTLHGGDILKKQGNFLQVFLTKLIVRRVHKAFILNDEMAEVMNGLNVPFETLPCGVNTEFFKPQYIKKNKENSRLIIFPGDPSREVKNFPLFEEVIKKAQSMSDYQIEYAYMHNLDRRGIRDLLNQADCLLMTSFSEGSPQVIKEALACDIPIVSVPVGDVRNVIDKVPGCFVSNSFDPSELSDLVLKVINSNKTDIRTSFLKKGIYENKSVCSKIVENYSAL